MRELMNVGCNALHRIWSSSGDGCSIGMDSLLMAQYIAPYGLTHVGSNRAAFRPHLGE